MPELHVRRDLIHITPTTPREKRSWWKAHGPPTNTHFVTIVKEVVGEEKTVLGESGEVFFKGDRQKAEEIQRRCTEAYLLGKMERNIQIIKPTRKRRAVLNR